MNVALNTAFHASSVVSPVRRAVVIICRRSVGLASRSARPCFPPFGNFPPWLYQRDSDDTALNGAAERKRACWRRGARRRRQTLLAAQCSLLLNDFSRAPPLAQRKGPFSSPPPPPPPPPPPSLLCPLSSFLLDRSRSETRAVHLSFLTSIHLLSGRQSRARLGATYSHVSLSVCLSLPPSVRIAI